MRRAWGPCSMRWRDRAPLIMEVFERFEAAHPHDRRF
jgi:hypothetical protein